MHHTIYFIKHSLITKPYGVKVNQTKTMSNNIINSAFNGLQVNDLANAEAVAQLLDKYQLRWSVSKQPLFLAGEIETPYYAIVREDNNAVFQTCKDSYAPFQNSELAELLIRISQQGGYEIHSGGMFNGGAKVYLQLASGNAITDIGENRSKVNGFISGINGHDGTTSLKWGSVNFTICCKNTFALAKRSLQNTLKHTTSMQKKIDLYLQDIGAVIKEEKSLFDTYIKLAEIQVDKKSIAKIVKSVTDVDVDLNKEKAEEIYSTYQINRTNELLSSISKEMHSKGNTMWGLFSGVTHYTSHVMPVQKRDNARLESKYTGTALRIDNDVLQLITKEYNLN